jgi:hypothetical protein
MAVGPGSRIGPYEVTALIGEGGMGTHHYVTRDGDRRRNVARHRSA